MMRMKIHKAKKWKKSAWTSDRDQIVMLLRNAWNKINNWIELEMIAESWKAAVLSVQFCAVYIFVFIQSGPSSTSKSRLFVFILFFLSAVVHI